MSAQFDEQRPFDGAEDQEHDGDQDGRSLVAGRPVEVRRNAALAALIGAAASAIAIAYLWRSSQSGALLDWVICGVMALIAAYYLASLVDSRTPLVVADDLGVRFRFGAEWRGLPWEGVNRVVVQHRRGLLRDGRLVFSPTSPGRAMDGLDARGRRQARLNQKMYGAALAVPLGMTTRVSVDGDRTLEEGIAALALGRADVVVLTPDPDAPVTDAGPGDPAVADPAVADPATGDPSGADPGDPSGGADWATAAGAPVRRRVRRRAVPPVIDEAQPSDDVRIGQMDPDAEAARESEAVRGAVDARSSRRRGGIARLLGAPRAKVAAPADPADDEGRDVGRDAGRDAEDSPSSTGATAISGTCVGDAADEPDEQPDVRTPRRSPLGGIATIVSRVAKGRTRDLDAVEEAGDPDNAGLPGDGVVAAEGAAVPDRSANGSDSPDASEFPPADEVSRAVSLRAARPALRAQVTRDQPATIGAVTPLDDTVGAASDATSEPDQQASTGRVRPIARLGDPVPPLVIDDFVTEPAYDPVIGPELAAARTRVGLTVDELAERTRIRPHVIESIEVDDFAPCGGDFYARGHLRTLARVLGQDVDPLLQQFEERYATAPVNARRVFEAELATGMTGSMRGTMGGANWGLLVGVVLTLLLVWGVVRFFASQSATELSPAPTLNGSAGISRTVRPTPAPVVKAPLKVTLIGDQGDSKVVVRSGSGKVVCAGVVSLDERQRVSATPPVRITAEDAGAVEVRVAGHNRGSLGELGAPGSRTFHRPRSTP